MMSTSPTSPARRQIMLGLAATAITTPAVASGMPEGDAALALAFQRWLDAGSAWHADTNQWSDDESWDRFIQSREQIYAGRASDMLGLTLKTYLLLNQFLMEDSVAGDHACAIPIEQDDAQAGLFEDLCRVVPELRDIAAARVGTAPALNAARLAPAARAGA